MPSLSSSPKNAPTGRSNRQRLAEYLTQLENGCPRRGALVFVDNELRLKHAECWDCEDLKALEMAVAHGKANGATGFFTAVRKIGAPSPNALKEIQLAGEFHGIELIKTITWV